MGWGVGYSHPPAPPQATLLESQFDSSMISHLESNSLFKGIPKTVQNEILNSMFEVCREEIQNEIKSSEFLAVMTDETTDISEKSLVVVTLRYEKKDKPVERFWGFFNPVDLTAETLASLVEAELTPLRGHKPEKLVAQTYDRAAVLSGVDRGVQARLKEIYNNAYLVHVMLTNLILLYKKPHHKIRESECFLLVFLQFQLFFQDLP